LPDLIAKFVNEVEENADRNIDDVGAGQDVASLHEGFPDGLAVSSVSDTIGTFADVRNDVEGFSRWVRKVSLAGFLRRERVGSAKLHFVVSKFLLRVSSVVVATPIFGGTARVLEELLFVDTSSGNKIVGFECFTPFTEHVGEIFSRRKKLRSLRVLVFILFVRHFVFFVNYFLCVFKQWTLFLK
jgi:hypothetical protein